MLTLALRHPRGRRRAARDEILQRLLRRALDPDAAFAQALHHGARRGVENPRAFGGRGRARLARTRGEPGHLETLQRLGELFGLDARAVLQLADHALGERMIRELE